MKKIHVLIFIIININSLAQKTFSGRDLVISLDEKLKISSIYRDREYLPDGVEGYLIRIKVGEDILIPLGSEWEKDNVTVCFERDINVLLSVKQMDEYLKVEVLATDDDNRIDVFFFGPFPTDIHETIGEIVGVVREDGYAIGIQSLNAKTTGGKYLNPDGSDAARGTTASIEDHGSSLQAYCINRNKDRIYAIWNNTVPEAFVPANADGKIEGSAIALFGCREEEVLNVIEQIELEQGLPHSTLNGKWSKISPDANKPYLITTFTEYNIDELIYYTKKLGYNALYHGHPFSTWGHFELIEEQFPNGWDGMKECVEKAKAEGIRLGAHTLTNFITTNDPFVSPAPDNDLMIFSRTAISRDISETDTEIYIEDTDGYGLKNTNQAQMSRHSMRSGLLIPSRTRS